MPRPAEHQCVYSRLVGLRPADHPFRLLDLLRPGYALRSARSHPEVVVLVLDRHVVQPRCRGTYRSTRVQRNSRSRCCDRDRTKEKETLRFGWKRELAHVPEHVPRRRVRLVRAATGAAPVLITRKPSFLPMRERRWTTWILIYVWFLRDVCHAHYDVFANVLLYSWNAQVSLSLSI